MAEALSKNEKFALRLSGFKRWLENLPRGCATIIIGKIKDLERRTEMERLAKDVKKRSEVFALRMSKCSLCGGKLKEDSVSATCEICGTPCFQISM